METLLKCQCHKIDKRQQHYNSLDMKSSIKKVIIYGFILHLFFLLSIFEIYFQSPIIEGLSPLEDIANAPAHRLVLFVADGLRAESFFKNDCERTPFLRNLIKENRAIVGLSHTHVPTESRPGHVALIAGFYEDPSAVARGWQENPIDFDSVFNRSSKTFCWGSPDIIGMFPKKSVAGRIVVDSYHPNDEDFSGKSNTIELDNWVFRKVKSFLENQSNDEFLLGKDKLILFLHLLGLDTAGHVHKPYSEHFSNNLIEVDKGIAEITKLIEEKFKNDKRTTYIFTSDHGMTDRGSHGGGEKYETETPIVIWGAGISNQTYISSLNITPQININQADITPLMSSLIGTAVPVNNVGVLPYSILNVTDNFLSKSLRNNAFQIANNLKYFIKIFKKSKIKFLIKEFPKLDDIRLNEIEKFIDSSIQNENYAGSIALSKKLIKLSIEGIEYYQSYYQTSLLTSIAMSMVAWLIFLLQHLLSSKNDTRIHTKNIVIGGIVSFLAFTVILLQNISLKMGCYFVLPIVCWSLLDYGKLEKLFLEKFNFIYLGVLIILAIMIELLVVSFFHRTILTCVLLTTALFQIIILFKSKNQINKITYLKWILSSIFLSIFPSLPVIDKNNNNVFLLTIGIGLWIIKQIQELNTKNNQLNLFLFIIFSVNLMLSIKTLNDKEGLSLTNQIVSWIFLVISFLLPLTSNTDIKNRIFSIGIGLVIPYSLMSLTYEPIFFIALYLNMCCWLKVEYLCYHKVIDDDQEFQRCDFLDNSNETRGVSWNDIRRGYLIILYILISFFGTGNIASVSSFDPNWVRCLVTTFSPFLMSALIIIKLLVPIILVTCFLKAIRIITEISQHKLFIILLIICDTICLNFLFLVTNKGSWLEIGTSISHFVIMEVTVLVLFLIYSLVNYLTMLKINIPRINDKKCDNNFVLPKTNCDNSFKKK